MATQTYHKPPPSLCHVLPHAHCPDRHRDWRPAGRLLIDTLADFIQGRANPADHTNRPKMRSYQLALAATQLADQSPDNEWNALH